NDFRFTLQERYQYLLLDEFQDTNEAQWRLVELLSDNPINEGRPNIMAVGDDDQAIYAFQGANYSHMLNFATKYRQILIVELEENYRSHESILRLAESISSQIEGRLKTKLNNSPDKKLIASGKNLPAKAVVERIEASSDAGQFAWVAHKIKQLIDSGINPYEIAVLAPQHKHLEPLVSFLHDYKLPVKYEKRENVLEDPAIEQILTMSELVLSLADSGKLRLNSSSLWPEVLSYDFWDLPTSLLWQISWKAREQKLAWTEVLIEHAETKAIALFFIRLSQLASSQTMEIMFDYITGSKPIDLHEKGLSEFRSPFYEYYFGASTRDNNLSGFWRVLNNLSVLRARLNEYKSDGPG
ncbi:MAG: UvrD-helicase domain-containing protein, partial [Candidatus Saccharimonadales bacterium]